MTPATKVSLGLSETDMRALTFLDDCEAAAEAAVGLLVWPPPLDADERAKVVRRVDVAYRAVASAKFSELRRWLEERDQGPGRTLRLRAHVLEHPELTAWWDEVHRLQRDLRYADWLNRCPRPCREEGL